LVRIGSGCQKQLQDLKHICAPRRAGLRPAAREGGDQRWESRVILWIRVGADLEEGANERQGAVIDRVLEATSDLERHRTIGNDLRVLDRGAQRGEVTAPERRVDRLEHSVLRAAVVGGGHRGSSYIGRSRTRECHGRGAQWVEPVRRSPWAVCTNRKTNI